MSAERGWKQPVLLATTANITLSAEQTIDGTLTSEDRVLVKDQTDTTENGIYVSSSGAWERATDFDAAQDFLTGTAVYVTGGSTNAGKQYNCTVSAEPPVVGTSTITWAEFTPSSSLGGDLTAVEALATTGIVRRTALNTWTAGTLVTNAESADMAQSTIKGRAVGAGTGVPTDLTATQATAILNVVAQDLKGLVPGPTAAEIAANKVLRADATWVAGAGDLLAANNLSDVAVAATAFDNIKQAATDAYAGTAELATDAEAITGTDTARVPAVSSMTAAIKARTESLIIPVTDENSVVISGTNKITFRMPYAMTLSAVRASLTVAQTSGTVVTVDINESGTTVISTKLTIDNGEKTSTTAAVPAVISDSAIADDAEITIDVDAVGDGTARGLKVYLIGTRV
jgi:hypothetical protein